MVAEVLTSGTCCCQGDEFDPLGLFVVDDHFEHFHGYASHLEHKDFHLSHIGKLCTIKAKDLRFCVQCYGALMAAGSNDLQ